eukprot:CAMPEP_0175051960 /NCGR_PEP_ID=MMETSP0052_2-20121109/8097_1 /TAXON_ID=51329 ORGANISM="Polytomella parva, Strain SAG 63-3" /NCGR_SAMPLE_ID=MMETSP0052_2 /ASSEMBLY_ACC=CAM_ASM_000194 /LENGTH=663 /DNA_ID=CAMNT_0016316317 /DNA_START=513 /DNA_END=2504 /DNA_ORIENTATION=-
MARDLRPVRLAIRTPPKEGRKVRLQLVRRNRDSSILYAVQDAKTKEKEKEKEMEADMGGICHGGDKNECEKTKSNPPPHILSSSQTSSTTPPHSARAFSRSPMPYASQTSKDPFEDQPFARFVVLRGAAAVAATWRRQASSLAEILSQTMVENGPDLQEEATFLSRSLDVLVMRAVDWTSRAAAVAAAALETHEAWADDWKDLVLDSGNSKKNVRNDSENKNGVNNSDINVLSSNSTTTTNNNNNNNPAVAATMSTRHADATLVNVNQIVESSSTLDIRSPVPSSPLFSSTLSPIAGPASLAITPPNATKTSTSSLSSSSSCFLSSMKQSNNSNSNNNSSSNNDLDSNGQRMQVTQPSPLNPSIQILETHVAMLTQKLAQSQAAERDLHQRTDLLQDQLQTLHFEKSMRNDGDMEREARIYSEQQCQDLKNLVAQLELQIATNTAHAEQKITTAHCAMERSELSARHFEALHFASMAELARVRQDSEDAVQKHAVQVAELTAVAASAKEEASKHAAEVESLKAQLQEEKVRGDDLQKKVGESVFNVNVALKRADEAESKFHRAMEQLISAQTGERQKCDEAVALKAKYDTLKGDAIIVQSKYQALKGEMVTLHGKYEAIKGSCAKLQKDATEVERMRNENKELMQMCNQLLNQVESFKRRGAQ